MIAFDSYVKTNFEILIKSRIRSFLYQKMYKNADVFADIERSPAAYKDFIEKAAWFEKQQQSKPLVLEEKCGNIPCPSGQYCTKNNKCETPKSGADGLNQLKEKKAEYYEKLRDYLKAESAMKGWYYSWAGGDTLNKAPGNAINQWNGNHPKVKSGEWPWAKAEEAWTPAGSTSGPVKVGIGSAGACREDGGTTPRDPEATYNKLDLWENHVSGYIKKLGEFWVSEDDEKSLVNQFDKDFGNPVNKWDPDKKDHVRNRSAMAACNKFWHFLWTPVKYAGVKVVMPQPEIIPGVPSPAPPIIVYGNKSLRWEFAEEFNDIEGFGGVYKGCQGSNSRYADVYNKCNSFFAAADSEYENKRNEFIPIKREYNSLARAMGVDPDSEGFLGDLDFNGVLKLYNVAAYTIAVLDGETILEPKEEVAEKQLEKMFIDIFEENIKLMGGSGTKSGEEIKKAYDNANKDSWEISGNHPIEQKLAEYNILVDNAIYNIIEPIR